MIRAIIKSIDKKEWWLWLVITFFIIVITTLPYWYADFITPAEHIYTGLHSLTPGDIHVYYSYLEQVRQGHYAFEDLYTSEAQPRVMMNIFWLAEGLVAKYSGLSNTLVFQLSRVALIPFFTFILYLVSAAIWRSKNWRKILFIFLCFASGWGAFGSFFLSNTVYIKHWYNWPLDLWSPEGNNLLTMFQSPHLITATSLIILSPFLAFLAFQHRNVKYAVFSGLSALVLFQFHPFHIPTVLGVISVYFLVRLVQLIVNVQQPTARSSIMSHLRLYLLMVGISFPSILYYLLLSEYDFGTQIRAYQNICLSPSLFVTALSYGLLFILAIAAMAVIFKKRKFSSLNIFLIVWLALQFGLLFSPFRFQRRMMQGLQIPMTILAVQGVYYCFSYLRSKMSSERFDFYIKNSWLLIILFIMFFTPSNLFNWARETQVILEVEPKFYIHQDLAEAYNWLRKNTSADSVVLSDFYSGNLIPGRAGRKVYVGHAVETWYFESKLLNMMWFYLINDQDDKKIKFLEENNIVYVFDVPQSRGLGDFNPEGKKYLRKVFEQGAVKIFKVIQPK